MLVSASGWVEDSSLEIWLPLCLVDLSSWMVGWVRVLMFPRKVEKRDRRWPIPVMGVMELAGVRGCWAFARVLDRVVRTLVPPPVLVGVPTVMVAWLVSPKFFSKAALLFQNLPTC